MKLHTGKDIIDLTLDDLYPQNVRITFISDLNERTQTNIEVVPIHKANSIHLGIKIPEGYKLMRSENDNGFFITMPDIDTNGFINLESKEPK